MRPSGFRAGRTAGTLVAILLLAACGGEPALEISVEHDPLPVDRGRTLVEVSVSGGDAADVDLQVDRGRLERIRADGNRVLADWVGLQEIGAGTARVQARLGAVRAQQVIRLQPGAPEQLRWAAETPWVDADIGVARLALRIEDRGGNPTPGTPPALSTSAGEIRQVVPQGPGRYAVEVTGLHSVLDNPVVVSVSTGELSAVTEVVVQAGAAAVYEFTLPGTELQATVPFPMALRSRDAQGNLRPVFGEIAHLRAYRLSRPGTEIPVSPISTNLFENGEVSMQVNLHAAGPDVVIEAIAPNGAVSRSPVLNVASVDVGCVVVLPTGLDGRIQESIRFGEPGGFPLQTVVYASDCETIRNEGQQFTSRIAGLEPRIWAHLPDGSLWGRSDQVESGGNRVGPVGFRAADVSYRFNVSGVTQVEYNSVRVTAEVDGHVGQLLLEVAPGPWHSITFERIPDQFQAIGQSFSIGDLTLEAGFPGFAFSAFARDLYGNLVPTAQGSMTCRLANPDFGTAPGSARIVPTTTLPPTLGIFNQLVSILDLGSSAIDVRVVCQKTDDPGVSGFSNVFRVYPFTLLSLATDGLSSDYAVALPGQTVDVDANPLEVSGTPVTQDAGVPFTIDLYARSQVTGDAITRPRWLGNVFVDTLLGGGVETAGGGMPSPLSRRMTCVRQDGGGFFSANPCDNNPLADLNERYSWIGAQQVTLTQAGSVVLTANPLVPSIPPAGRSGASIAPGLASALTVRPGAAKALRWATPPPVTAPVGAAFPVALQVVDEWGNAVTAYQGEVLLSDLTRSVHPKQLTVVDGRAEGDLYIYTPRDNNMLFVEEPGLGVHWSSDVFDVR